MGLLTDPSASQGKLTKTLLKYYNKICILLYLGAIAWFCSLAYREVNNTTYFSENALLPGLVRSEFHEESVAKRFYEELRDEMHKYDNSIPYPWLQAKFRQIGLDTYTHNFTLNYPLGKPQKFKGKNVYGILRAARAASTESIVLSVPYRPPLSPHETTAPSIAILLAFAQFANKEKYWAKDIIFLITEHEQLGIQAWLEAYHGIQCGDDGVLDYGDLKGRGGAIQAAINLELHDTNIGQIDIKIEGLNGQLPNLDLFNLAAKMCMKESVYHTFKGREAKNLKDAKEDWFYAFKTLLAMVGTQATGIPNGNHGLYHRFGIEALTLEGFRSSSPNHWRAGFLVMGRILEGIFRSLNNLLERFHQSYFFYLLPSTNRYISISLYIPSICAIAGTLFVKACAKWCQLEKSEIEKREKKSEESSPKTLRKSPKLTYGYPSDHKLLAQLREQFEYDIANATAEDDDDGVDFGGVITHFFTYHILGVCLMYSPPILASLGETYGYSKDVSIFYGFIVICGLLLALPLVVSLKGDRTVTVLNILALLELGTVLVGIGVTNISLSLFIGTIYVPFALMIGQNYSKLCAFLQKVVWLLTHPLLLLSVVVLVNTYLLFPREPPKELIYRSIDATQQSIIYAIVDSMIYGNWLYNVVTSVFIPNWYCFWALTFRGKANAIQVNLNKKKN